MSKKQIIKEIELLDGKWVSGEKEFNADNDNELVLTRLRLSSSNGQKQMILFLDDDGVPKLRDIDNNDFRILLVGINSQSGTVVFDGAKSMRVDFGKHFKNTPAVNITLDDPSNSPAYKTYPGTTGFTIRFSQPFTGVVSWLAVES